MKLILGIVLAAVAAVGLAEPAAAVPPTPRSAQSSHWRQQGLTGIRGVDLSLWDHYGKSPLNFKVLQAQGVRFAFIKASDTNNRADGQAAGWWRVDRPAARRAKILVGGYQYATPIVGGRDALIANARRAAVRMSNRMGVIPRGQLPAVLDLESAPYRLGKTGLTLWATTWLDVVEHRTGRTPILYTYTYFAQSRLLPTAGLTRFPFWQAEFNRGVSRPGTVAGWPENTPTFWQFTSVGKLAGKGGTDTDLDVYMGDSAGLLALAGLPARAATAWGLPPS